MKCLTFYVTAVYGEIRGIFNGKAWAKTVREFQSVAAVF